MRLPAAAVLLPLALAAAPRWGGAQQHAPWGSAPGLHVVPDDSTSPRGAALALPGAGAARPGVTPWWAPLASAALPGAGQAAQRQRRAVAYLAAEAFLLAQYLQSRDDGRRHRSEYRQLAQVARTFFTNRFPVGDFEYYETMEKFVESGDFDVDPAIGVQPETDTTTFNGFTWQLARRTFWEDPSAPPPAESPAYRQALSFYRERAFGPEFQWSWRNAQLEQDLFRRSIRSSNAAFRLSSNYLAMIIANHALSAVDAFVVLRLRRSASEHSYRLDASIPWAPFGRPAAPSAGAGHGAR